MLNPRHTSRRPHRVQPYTRAPGGWALYAVIAIIGLTVAVAVAVMNGAL